MSYSQTDYYYYDSRTGTSEKIGYSKPANTLPVFSPYRGVDVDLYRRVGEAKQRRYDENVKSIRDYINSLYDSIDDLEDLDAKRAAFVRKQLDDYLAGLDPKNDYSRTEVYNWMIDNLNTVKSNIRRLKQGAIEDLKK